MKELINKLEQEKAEYVIKQSKIEDFLEEEANISQHQKDLLEAQMSAFFVLINILNARINDLRN